MVALRDKVVPSMKMAGTAGMVALAAIVLIGVIVATGTRTAQFINTTPTKWQPNETAWCNSFKSQTLDAILHEQVILGALTLWAPTRQVHAALLDIDRHGQRAVASIATLRSAIPVVCGRNGISRSK